MWCSNVVGRVETTVEGNVHLHDPDLTKVIQHSPATYEEMVVRLRAQIAAGGVGRTNELAQIFGMNYEPHSMLFDDYVRSLVSYPKCAYFDWMHCVATKGGIAQLEVNALVRLLLTHGVTLTSLDEFGATIRWPKNTTKLSRCFFQRRVVDKDGACIRSFAGETLSAITLLGAFLDIVVKPLGLIPEHRACFSLLCEIVDLLRLWSVAPQHLAKLDRVLYNHHVMYVYLYPSLGRPKLHYLRHLPQCIEEHGALLS